MVNYFISHRGNIEGRNKSRENHPSYIDNAIEAGYDAEIDVWVIEGTFWLGHDEPQYGVTMDWLNTRSDNLWIHCKNIEAVEWFSGFDGFWWFWHETDTVTLTSGRHIWAYPGKQPIKRSIAVLPEVFQDDVSECIGICSDYIKKYKDENQ